MKNVRLLVTISVLGMFTSCAQSSNSKKGNDKIIQKKLPDNFLDSAGNVSANTQGIIHLEAEYLVKNNNIGNAEIYLIHKKGGAWWCQQAKRRFPNNYYAERFFADFLLKKDTINLNNYNKWAFFIDKKYLEKRLESAEGGEFISHYPSRNSEILIVLYEQKAGSSNWIAIDSIPYKTDSEGNEIGAEDEKGNYYSPSYKWERNFLEEKLKESND